MRPPCAAERREEPELLRPIAISSECRVAQTGNIGAAKRGSAQKVCSHPRDPTRGLGGHDLERLSPRVLRLRASECAQRRRSNSRVAIE